MTAAALFFSADGRIGQGRFLVAVACLLAAGALIALVGPLSPPLWIVAFYSWICVQSKRLHDMGRSGWLQALPFLLGWTLMSLGVGLGVLSLIGVLASRGGDLQKITAGGALIGLGAFLAGAATHLALILWLGLSSGRRGFNRWGPDPSDTGKSSL